MTEELEFYNEFNVLYNNIMSNKAPGLDEYEVSVLLTLAQEEFVISLYKGSQITGASFEGSEESRRYLGNLLSSDKPTLSADQTGLRSSMSKRYDLQEDVLFITEEYGTIKNSNECLNGTEVTRVPTKQDEVGKILRNPFRQPNSKRALRLDVSSNSVEIINPFEIDYNIKYLKKPEPIILKDLSPEEVSIGGKTQAAKCQLHSSTHKLIIKRAVELAKASYGK